ncbi:MAG: dephospho-CoA kinase [Gemmatimonadales bacterium]|nr:dephospho-CoA kinase [Gemmatimonadales bacterium]
MRLPVLSIALTGNIASGKSAVAELFRRWGATLIDADRLVREAQMPGGEVLRAIVERFGVGMLRPDGALDRAALRAEVMEDADSRADLNRIVHPEVHRRRAELVAEARARGDRILVSDIPLLFEVMDPAEFDAVVLVDSPEEIRRARLMEERGLTPEEADRMIRAQLPASEKRARSDYVIDNVTDRAALERAAAEVWRALLARA